MLVTPSSPRHQSPCHPVTPTAVTPCLSPSNATLSIDIVNDDGDEHDADDDVADDDDGAGAAAAAAAMTTCCFCLLLSSGFYLSERVG